MTFRKVLSLAVLLLATVPLALAQGTYTQIDYPGGGDTKCFGIDTAGDVSGYYQDGTGHYHGFLLSAGIYSSIDYPGAEWTEAYGMNDMGQIVGSTEDAYFGFLYDIQAQTFTKIAYPAGKHTTPFAINNAGTIVGSVYHLGINQGFELIGSTYTKIFPPNATSAYAIGITSSGELVGSSTPPTGAVVDFSFNQGKYQKLPPPSGLRGVFLTNINPAGTATVGYYQNTKTTITGFVYQNGSVQTLQFPGATFTYPFGINSGGVVVGQFFAADGWHGFTWTPPADAGKK
jgi:uncharacterized membrane protein